MSDNGIMTGERDLALEVFDLLGISERVLEQCQDEWFKVNKRVSQPDELKKLIGKWTNALSNQQVQDESQDVNAYKKHILVSKQMKTVAWNKAINHA